MSPSVVRTNKRLATCEACGATIEPGRGRVWHDGTQWRISCGEGTGCQGRPGPDQAATGPDGPDLVEAIARLVERDWTLAPEMAGVDLRAGTARMVRMCRARQVPGGVRLDAPAFVAAELERPPRREAIRSAAAAITTSGWEAWQACQVELVAVAEGRT